MAEKHGDILMNQVNIILKDNNPSPTKYQQSIDLLNKTITYYISDEYTFGKAAQAYSILGDCFLKINNFAEAATSYQEAGMYMEMIDPVESIEQYKKSTQFLEESKEYSTLGRVENKMSEIAEDLQMKVESIQHNNNSCEISKLQVQDGCYYKSVMKIYKYNEFSNSVDSILLKLEDVARIMMLENRTKYSVKRVLLKCCILRLLHCPIDVVRENIDKYTEIDNLFGHSKESQFIMSLCYCVELNNGDEFLDHVFNYESVCELDTWSLKLLKKIYDDIKVRKEVFEEE